MLTNDNLVDKTKSKKNMGESGEIWEQKKKSPGFRKNLVDYFQEYTDYTGIHGFKYIGEKERSVVEK